MRVADFIARALARHGVQHVFMVAGGGAMHLNDAFGREPALTKVFCHHEQACAMAAEGYTRLSGRLAAVNVTTGPGGVNALNGVYGAYTDSIAMIVVSGQVKRETMVASCNLPLRQLGDQEIDIVRMAGPVCKFAAVLGEPRDARYIVEKALWFAQSGRPGPVWIDVPSDVQAARIDPAALRGFDPLAEGRAGAALALEAEANPLRGEHLDRAVASALEKLSAAQRPVIMVGTGARIAGAHESFLRVVDKLGVPVATAFNAHDAIWNDHPLYAGRPGTVGDRAGNFAVQNADFLLVLGCRLNIRQISYNWKSFARAAFKVMVDIDRAEMEKPTLAIDMPIHADLADFLAAVEKTPFKRGAGHAAYVGWCRERVAAYPVVLPEYRNVSRPINPYCFMGSLFDALDESDIVVTGDGTACVAAFQAAIIKKGQRLFSNSGSASMGYDLPAAIGAHYASGRRVVCLAGDGSVMMNLQELQTIVGNRLPIKLFVLNNGGYSSIIQTQRSFFPDNIVGCGPESGVTFPDFRKVLEAFGFGFARVDHHEEMSGAIQSMLAADGPQAMEVMLDPAQPFAPKLSSRKLEDGAMVSSPMEDLHPFLPRDELARNMLIPPMPA